MYPIHHPTLKIEQAEREAAAARTRRATPVRRGWRSWRSLLGSTTAVAPVPRPHPTVARTTPAVTPMAAELTGDDRVLVGR